MKKKVFETERLFLRQFTPADADFIVQLVNTDGWLRFIGDRNIKSTEQAIEYLKNGPIKSYQVNGFGLYMAVLETGGTPIGMCGLIKREYLEFIDLGFALLPEYTSRGYATGMAKETIRFAFEKQNQKKVLAIVLQANEASISVQQKIGCEYEKSFTSTETNQELFIYQVHNNEKSTKIFCKNLNQH